MRTKESYEEEKNNEMERLDEIYWSSPLGQLKQAVKESKQLRDEFYG